MIQTRKRRRAQIIVSLSVLAVAVAGVLVVGSIQKESKPKPVDKSEVTIPKAISPVGSIAVDKSGAAIDWKLADNKVVRVETVIDLHCPACKAVEGEIAPSIEKIRDDGSAQLWYTPVSFLNAHSNDEYSARAASALITVAEVSPAHFSKYLTALFENQPGMDADYKKVSTGDLEKLAVEIGVSKNDAAKIGENKYATWAQANTDFQSNRVDMFPAGSISTPTISVGGTMSDDNVLSGHSLVNFNGADFRESFDTLYSEVRNGK